jgi:hypothetical protein
MSVPSHIIAPIPGFAVNFSRLDQWIRREVFRYLYNNLNAIAGFTTHHPAYVHEIGALLFHSYRSLCPGHLFCFLAALMDVPEFSSHVETITLDEVFDGPRRSGFWYWLWELGGAVLPPGHSALSLQRVGRWMVNRAEETEIDCEDFHFRGTKHWPLRYHTFPLLSNILPGMCPNLVEVTFPHAWGSQLKRRVWQAFPNVMMARRI